MPRTAILLPTAILLRSGILLRSTIISVVILVSGITRLDSVSGQERDVFLQIDTQVHTSTVQAIAFSSNDHLCSAGYDKQVIGWNVRRPPRQPPRLVYDRTIRWDIQRGDLGAIYAMDTAPSAIPDPLVAFAGKSSRGSYSEVVWASTRNGHYLDYRNSGLMDGIGDVHNSITSLSLSSDGKFTLTTDINQKTVLWSPEKVPTLIAEFSDADLKLLTRFEPAYVSTIAGNLMVVPKLVSIDNQKGPVWKLVSYPLVGGQPDQRAYLPSDQVHRVTVRALAASRDGRYLASAQSQE